MVFRVQATSLLARRAYHHTTIASTTASPLRWIPYTSWLDNFDSRWYHRSHSLSASDRSTVSASDLVISLLGPPNAGKSTLYNRLECKEKNRSYRLKKERKRGRRSISSKFVSQGGAIVSNIPGTTRDRREGWGRLGDTEFRILDTAGVDGDRIHVLQVHQQKERHGKRGAAAASAETVVSDYKQDMEQRMMRQTLHAAEHSDLVFLLWDAKVGVTQDLTVTARWLRKLGKKDVVVLANKLEGDRWVYDDQSPVMNNLEEVRRLGLGDPVPISALHGDGMADIAMLIEKVKAKKASSIQSHAGASPSAEEVEETKGKKRPLQLAILGRQNTGKSTLVNKLLKEDRVISGPTPGLTRDAIVVEWMWNDQPVQLVDTAGIRKLNKRMDDEVEDMSVADALRAMKVAEVAVLVLDAEALFLQRQELAICNAVIEEGRSLVVAANKMDLLEMSAQYTSREFADSVRDQLEARMPMLRGTPIVPMSSLTGAGVSKLLPVVADARNRWSRTVSTGLLNRWLREVVTGAPLPVVSGKRVKLKYIVQLKARPPTFTLFCNVRELPETYVRYLTKHFQDSFELYGMPVRLMIQQSSDSNPFHKKGKSKRVGFGIGGRAARINRKTRQYLSKRKKERK